MYFKDLDVYKRAYSLVLTMHRLTSTFPKHEQYEIGNQLRRAAVSIVLNIAEGYGRLSSDKETINFLRISLGSTNECEVLVDICRDLGYLDKDLHLSICSELRIICSETRGLITSLKKRLSST